MVLHRRVAIASLLVGSMTLALSAHAVELNGVWASDLALCGKIFAKKGNRLEFDPLSDFYGSGFIIEQNRIRGKIADCTIKSRREDAGMVQLSAACSTDVAVEDLEFSLKVINEDTLGRIYPGTAAMQVNFHRCRS